MWCVFSEEREIMGQLMAEQIEATRPGTLFLRELHGMREKTPKSS